MLMERIAAYIACFTLGFTLAFWMNNSNKHRILQDQITTLRAEVLLLKIKHERGADHSHEKMD